MWLHKHGELFMKFYLDCNDFHRPVLSGMCIFKKNDIEARQGR